MEILVRNPAHLGNVLETLDVQQHSLGVLAVSSIYTYIFTGHLKKINEKGLGGLCVET